MEVPVGMYLYDALGWWLALHHQTSMSQTVPKVVKEEVIVATLPLQLPHLLCEGGQNVLDHDVYCTKIVSTHCPMLGTYLLSWTDV